MVIVKPMQVLIVSVDPTNVVGEKCAITVENCGESPTTTTPHVIIATKNKFLGSMKRSGEHRQIIPESNS